MGVHILEGVMNGTKAGAVMICSTSGLAFGPVFADAEAIERFQAYVRRHNVRDVRMLAADGIADAHARWKAEDATLPLPLDASAPR